MLLRDFNRIKSQSKAVSRRMAVRQCGVIMSSCQHSSHLFLLMSAGGGVKDGYQVGNNGRFLVAVCKALGGQTARKRKDMRESSRIGKP
jgi:hypothetical protein